MATLVTLQGPDVGREYKLADPPQGAITVLGRQADATICLVAAAVSRHHAQIVQADGGYFLEDLDSRNGTFLNGTRISPRVRVPLTERDTIQIGPYRFGLQLASSTEPYLLIRDQIPAHSQSVDRQGLPKEVQAMRETVQQLSLTLGPKQLLDRLLDQLMSLFPQADRALLLLCEEERLVIHNQRLREGEGSPHYVCSRSIARKALDEGVGILGDSLQSDQRFQASSSLLSLDVHSLLCIPLLGPQGSRLGVLQLDRRGHGLPFRTEDLQLLSTLGMLIAEILERAVREAERSPTEHQPPESALPRTGTSWPNASDYQDAMQHPARCFRDRWLRGCMAEKNTLGVAKPRAGTSAHVYKLQHGPEAKAVKVFLYPQREREERYQIISDYLKERGQPSCLVSFHYEPSGIRIHNEWYPVLTMDWVPGVTLETWIGQVVQAGDRGRLLLMAERWVRLVEELQAASICHGDLQHGNILVANDTPALMDYDTLCVPPLVGRDSLEEGRHGYQHPARRGQKLSLEMDHFSAWIIFIALRALAADLTLWDPYGPRQKICHLDGSWFSTDSSESRHIQVADLLA